MNRFKIIYFTILLWLSVCGCAFGKAEPIVRNFTTECPSLKGIPVWNTVFSIRELKNSHCTFAKKEAASVLISKGMRRKALPLDTDLLPDFYCVDFVTLRCFDDTMIYTLIVRYTVPTHTYLHLYQLF